MEVEAQKLWCKSLFVIHSSLYLGLCGSLTCWYPLLGYELLWCKVDIFNNGFNVLSIVRQVIIYQYSKACLCEINNLIYIFSMSQNSKATAIYEYVLIIITFMWLWMLLIETRGLKFSCLKFKCVTLLWDHMQTYILEYNCVELKFKHVVKII